MPALGFVIIGHYSINGELLKEHFNTTPEAQRSNVFLSDVKDVGDGVPTSVFESLIYTLSYEGQCIIDATTGSSMYTSYSFYN